MEQAVAGTSYFYYPRLVCIVGVRDDVRDGTNFAPVTWAGPLSSDPALFGVCLSPSTTTHQLVLRTGEFTVNYLDREHASLAGALGRLSGRNVDKVKELGLALCPAEVMRTPTLEVAYAAAECLLIERHHVGDQTLFVGRVERVVAREDAFDGFGVLRLDRISPLLYLGGSRYATTDPASETSEED